MTSTECRKHIKFKKQLWHNIHTYDPYNVPKNRSDGGYYNFEWNTYGHRSGVDRRLCVKMGLVCTLETNPIFSC